MRRLSTTHGVTVMVSVIEVDCDYSEAIRVTVIVSVYSPDMIGSAVRVKLPVSTPFAAAVIPTSEVVK